MWLLLAKSLFTQGSISKPLQWNLPSFPSFKFMWYMLEKPYASKNNKQPAVAALAHQSTQTTASNDKISGNERELPDRQTCTNRHAPCQPHASKRTAPPHTRPIYQKSLRLKQGTRWLQMNPGGVALLGFAAPGVCYQESPVVVQENVLDLPL